MPGPSHQFAVPAGFLEVPVQAGARDVVGVADAGRQGAVVAAVSVVDCAVDSAKVDVEILGLDAPATAIYSCSVGAPPSSPGLEINLVRVGAAAAK